MALRVTLAGRVGIEVDDGEVPAAGLGRPGRLALAYLTCERHRAVPRDELADVLWGDERPQSWDQMLRGLALKLRGVLSAAGLDPTEALSTAAGAFRLHLPPDAVVDVEEAAAALASADASLAAGYPGPARVQASAALAVTSRQFAPTLTGAWVERRQADLAELHLRALEAQARAAVGEGDWAGAIAASEEAIAREPFRESAYLVLMDAHAGAGNRGEALRAYSRCREVLVEELGVDPSPPTEAAYLRLLGDEPAPTEATSAALPLPAALAPVPGAFLVGRNAEAEVVASALKRAGVEGRQAVLVGGEPGAGKTSLVAGAARSAHAGGARVLYGRCDEELGLAYQPFAQALGHYVATAPTAELKAHVAASGAVLARLVPELTRRLPAATPPPATDAESDRWALFEAVTDVLVRASADTTVVLVIDDLHWAAPGTLALLRHLLADPSRAALLILGTYRHTDTPPGSPLATTLADLRRAPGVERIALEGLDADGVAAFVEAAGNTDDDDGALARALHAHTAGNPFFVGELLRHLAETGATYRRQAPWSYYSDAHGLEVPEAAVEVVGRRLGRLSPEANRALVLAAVTGAEFDLEVVESAEVEQADTVLDGLEEAHGASLIVELDRPGHYRFAHALVRDAIYRKLSGARRARLHRQVGEAMESLPGDDASRLPALAHHFAEAASAGGAAKAADYALAAAEQAADQAAWELAVSHLDRGLEALSVQAPVDLERRCELLLEKAEYLGHAASTDLSELWATSLEAADAARAVGSARLLARVAAAYNHPRRPGGEVGRALCDEALARLGDDDPGLRASVLIALAQTRTLDVAAVTALSIEALALARVADAPAVLRWALRLRAERLLGTPALQELRDLADEMAGFPRTDPVARSIGTRFGVVADLAAGDRAGFDAGVEELERNAVQLHSWLLGSQAVLCRFTAAMLDGRFEELEELLRALHAVRSPAIAIARVTIARLRFDQGRLQDPDARPAETAGAAGPCLRALEALRAAEEGDLAGARQELNRMADSLEEVPGAFFPSRPITSARLAEVAYALGEDVQAPALHQVLAPFAGSVLVLAFAAECAGPADHYLGLLAATLGRHDQAAGHFEEALRLGRSLASPPLVAATQLAYGRLLLARKGPGDAERAAGLLAECLATTRRLGLTRLARQAESLLVG